MNKWIIIIKCQIKSKLNSRKFIVCQISYMLTCLQVYSNQHSTDTWQTCQNRSSNWSVRRHSDMSDCIPCSMCRPGYMAVHCTHRRLKKKIINTIKGLSAYSKSKQDSSKEVIITACVVKWIHSYTSTCILCSLLYLYMFSYLN